MYLYIKGLLAIIKEIWKAIISILTSSMITYIIYPSLISEIQYCEIGDWVPVILVTAYSVTDITGRVSNKNTLLLIAITFSVFDVNTI